MPVYLFALATAPQIMLQPAILLFVILHLLVYPASNGYNSYMDRDESPIGLLANPEKPTLQLFYTTIVLDVLGLVLAFYVSLETGLLVAVYIVFSRLYSYRGVRLKRFPVIGYLTVILNQGGLTFYIVYKAVSGVPPEWVLLLSATLLIGGFYPITQVYQHHSDAKDGVNTLSMLLGVKGTFLWCAACYAMAIGLLLLWSLMHNKMQDFLVIQLCFLPVLFFFFRWVVQVWQSAEKADFKNTMRMNWIASTFTNLAFLIILIRHTLD